MNMLHRNQKRCNPTAVTNVRIDTKNGVRMDVLV